MKTNKQVGNQTPKPTQPLSSPISTNFSLIKKEKKCCFCGLFLLHRSNAAATATKL
jgi:hypothetical protein